MAEGVRPEESLCTSIELCSASLLLLCLEIDITLLDTGVVNELLLIEFSLLWLTPLNLSFIHWVQLQSLQVIYFRLSATSCLRLLFFFGQGVGLVGVQR